MAHTRLAAAAAFLLALPATSRAEAQPRDAGAPSPAFCPGGGACPLTEARELSDTPWVGALAVGLDGAVRVAVAGPRTSTRVAVVSAPGASAAETTLAAAAYRTHDGQFALLPPALASLYGVRAASQAADGTVFALGPGCEERGLRRLCLLALPAGAAAPQRVVLPGSLEVGAALALDARGRPWVAYWRASGLGARSLAVRTPEGAVRPIATIPNAAGASSEVSLLAPSATDARAVVTYHARDAVVATTLDRGALRTAVVHREQARGLGLCGFTGTAATPQACAATPPCVVQRETAGGDHAVVRLGDGSLWVAQLVTRTEQTLRARPVEPVQMPCDPPPACRPAPNCVQEAGDELREHTLVIGPLADPSRWRRFLVAGDAVAGHATARDLRAVARGTELYVALGETARVRVLRADTARW